MYIFIVKIFIIKREWTSDVRRYDIYTHRRSNVSRVYAEGLLGRTFSS